jgi:hypothetical protein
LNIMPRSLPTKYNNYFELSGTCKTNQNPLSRLKNPKDNEKKIKLPWTR